MHSIAPVVLKAAHPQIKRRKRGGKKREKRREEAVEITHFLKLPNAGGFNRAKKLLPACKTEA